MPWTENTLNKATDTRACTLTVDYTEKMRKSCAADGMNWKQIQTKPFQTWLLF